MSLLTLPFFCQTSSSSMFTKCTRCGIFLWFNCGLLNKSCRCGSCVNGNTRVSIRDSRVTWIGQLPSVFSLYNVKCKWQLPPLSLSLSLSFSLKCKHTTHRQVRSVPPLLWSYQNQTALNTTWMHLKNAEWLGFCQTFKWNSISHWEKAPLTVYGTAYLLSRVTVPVPNNSDKVFKSIVSEVLH